MFNKIRRNSKQLLESKRNSSVSAITGSTLTTASTRRRKLTFFDLPAEIRNVSNFRESIPCRFGEFSKDQSLMPPLRQNPAATPLCVL